MLINKKHKDFINRLQLFIKANIKIQTQQCNIHNTLFSKEIMTNEEAANCNHN